MQTRRFIVAVALISCLISGFLPFTSLVRTVDIDPPILTSDTMPPEVKTWKSVVSCLANAGAVGPQIVSQGGDSAATDQLTA